MKHFIFLLIAPLIIVSCETLVKDFDIKKPDDKITIVGYAIADSAPFFYITKNIGLDEPEIFLPLKDAVAELYKNNEFLTNLTLNNNKWYSFSDYKFEPGNRYALKVSSGGYEPVTANFEVPDPPELLSVDTNLLLNQPNYNCIECGGSDYLEFEMNFINTPETEDFFSVEVNSTGKCLDGSYYGTCSNNYFEMPPHELISNAPFIETYRVYNDSYYNRNASEEAIGFAFYFSDKLLQDGQNILKFKTRIFYYVTDTTPEFFATLVFKKIDKAMYEYVRSQGKNYNAEGNPFVQPVSIYSNVENGLGLVSGYSVVEYTVDISEIIRRISSSEENNY